MLGLIRLDPKRQKVRHGIPPNRVNSLKFLKWFRNVGINRNNLHFGLTLLDIWMRRLGCINHARGWKGGRKGGGKVVRGRGLLGNNIDAVVFLHYYRVDQCVQSIEPYSGYLRHYLHTDVHITSCFDAKCEVRSFRNCYIQSYPQTLKIWR